MKVNHSYYKVIFLVYYFSMMKKYINRSGAIEFLLGTNIVDFIEYESCPVFGSIKSISRRKISHLITTCIKNEYIEEISEGNITYLMISFKGINYLNAFPKEISKITNNKKIEKNTYFYKKI